MQKNSEYRLKSCPFCGGQAEIMQTWDGLYQAVCRRCRCGTAAYAAPSAAALRWNQRSVVNDEMDMKATFPIIDSGRNDFGCILTASVRYSLGRKTYMPSLVTSFIRPFLPYLNYNTVLNLQKDISEFRDYGDDCDVQTWTAFLADVRAEVRKRGITR